MLILFILIFILAQFTTDLVTNIQLDVYKKKGGPIFVRMKDVMILMTDVCIPPEDDSEIWSKHVVGKNKYC
jgi:hypothetical protein